MNIRQAKEEIKHTIGAYLKKDETGAYKIPVRRQRPLLLIGPRGLEKRRSWSRPQESVGSGSCLIRSRIIPDRVQSDFQ